MLNKRLMEEEKICKRSSSDKKNILFFNRSLAYFSVNYIQSLVNFIQKQQKQKLRKGCTLLSSCT